MLFCVILLHTSPFSLLFILIKHETETEIQEFESVSLNTFFSKDNEQKNHVFLNVVKITKYKENQIYCFYILSTASHKYCNLKLTLNCKNAIHLLLRKLNIYKWMSVSPVESSETNCRRPVTDHWFTHMRLTAHDTCESVCVCSSQELWSSRHLMNSFHHCAEGVCKVTRHSQCLF